MRFSTKVFIAIFLCGFIGVSVMTLILSNISIQGLNKDFDRKYKDITTTLGNTLFELEGKTESLMSSAIRALDAEIATTGILSQSKIKSLAADLGVSQLYITDNTGRFLRSTKEEPKGLPNIFSFCPTYEGTFKSRGSFLPTGIMPGFPSGLPHKFLLMSSRDNKYVLEVGVHADYIGRNLDSIAKADSNIVAITLRAPKGQVLAQYGDLQKNPQKVQIFSREIPSVRGICCSCNKRGLSDDKYFYHLDVSVNTAPLIKAQGRIAMVALIAAFIMAGLCYILARLLSRRLVERVHKMDQFVSSIAESKSTSERLNLKGKDELSRLGQHFDQMMQALEDKEKEAAKFTQKEAIVQITSQLAHDIRSPLTALSLMRSQKMDSLPEETRILLRSAVNRIQDVANDLLRTGTRLANGDNLSEESPEVLEPTLLSPLIENLASEKRIQVSATSQTKIDFKMKAEAFGVFAYVDKSALMRLLSNIVDNGIEAMEDGGTVTLKVDRHDQQVRIIVKDTGPGIAPEILSRLGERGVTFGKEDGHGLGIHYAKSTIERWGGGFQVASSSSGVDVTILLSEAPPPSWFFSKLNIKAGDTLVTIDDDPSIHASWMQLLSTAIRTQGLSVKNFVDLASASSWIRRNPNIECFTFLVDFEFLREKTTGLDFIEGHGIQSKSILVTSHHESSAVITRCLKLSVPLLPKILVPWLPITVLSSSDEVLSRSEQTLSI